MKKDLLIAVSLVLLAGFGIGVVVVLPSLQKDDDTPKTIRPKPEPIALLPKKEDTKKPVDRARKEPLKPGVNEKKKGETKTPIEKTAESKNQKSVEKKALANAEPEPKKKDEGPPQPINEDPKRPIAKIIRLGDDLIKLNDPGGEFTLKPMHKGMRIELIGKIKTLNIAAVNDRSVLDVSGLVAEEIIFTGNINSGSKVLLGQARTLKIRAVNDRSLLDASALEARDIHLEGAVNSGSTVKLHALKGSVEFFGEVNDRSQIDIAAPGGKVVFKSRGDSVINGDAKLTVLARDVDFAGAINGLQTQVNVTLTKDGSLKFRRLSGGVQLLCGKADAGDPEPRIEAGHVDARAVFRMLPAGKKR
jgi:hypothetical protein